MTKKHRLFPFNVETDPRKLGLNESLGFAPAKVKTSPETGQSKHSSLSDTVPPSPVFLEAADVISTKGSLAQQPIIPRLLQSSTELAKQAKDISFDGQCCQL